MKTEPRQRPYLATLWMVGAMIALSGMAVAGRELSSELNAFQISFTRSFICLFSLIVLLTFIGFKRVKTKKIKLHIFRNTIHFGLAIRRRTTTLSGSLCHRIHCSNLDGYFSNNTLKRTAHHLSNRQYPSRFHRYFNYLTTGIADNSTRCISSFICNDMFRINICIYAAYVVHREPVNNYFLYEFSTTPNWSRNVDT